MGFMHKFAYSFFDFATYKEFLVQGLGKSILYIFLVTLIFSTINNVSVIGKFNSQISGIQSTFIHSAPNFELKNGLLYVNSDEPIYYKYHGDFLANFIFSNIIVFDKISTSSSLQNNLVTSKSNSGRNNALSLATSDEPNSYILIVDTSGKTNSSALDSYSDGIYIDSNVLVLKQNYQTIHTVKFSNYSKLTLTNETVQNMLSNLKISYPIIFLILGPIFSFLLNLISGFLILGPLSLNISSLMGIKLKYSKACILSFYAMTLPLLLESLLDISGIDLPEFYFIFYIVALIYCGLAIKELKNTDKSNLNLIK